MTAWTAPEIFARVWKTLLKQPLGLLIALAFVPSLWAVPIEFAHTGWIPEGTPAFGSERSGRAFTLSFAAVVWEAIWAAGCVRIAVDAARGRPVRFRHFLSGLAYTPWIVCTALPLLPLEFVTALPLEDDPSAASLAFGSVIAVTIVLLARTALWAPFMLDAGTSIVTGLSASWSATRERVASMLLLACLLMAPVVPIALVEMAVSGRAYVATGLANLFYTLAIAHLYTLTRDTERSLIKAGSS